MIIAAEMKAPLRITSGPTIQHSGDLAAILSSLTGRGAADEMHHYEPPSRRNALYGDGRFPMNHVVGKGAEQLRFRELPQFTLVGAWRAGLLPGRCVTVGFTGHLEVLFCARVRTILRRSAGLMDMRITSEG